jgi:predicted secreted hydrolase
VKRVEVLVVGLLFAAAATDAAPPPAWTTVQPGIAIELPRDHGGHPETLTEWWYLTGTVHDAAGDEYGFQLTFFRRGIDPAPPAPGASALRARHVLASHLAVADIARNRLLHAERVRRADGWLAGVSETDLHVWLDRWELRRGPGDELTAVASDPAHGLALDLRLHPRKPPVLHGVGGYSRKGPEPGNASAYFSWTRLEARGTLTVGARRLEVAGEAWFDHEWGTSQLGAGVVGWDWFGLQLADGRELTAFALRRADGSTDPFSAGTLIAADGSTRPLAAGEFTVEPLAPRRSPGSGAVYASRWRIRVPSAGLDLEAVPRIRDAEIDARRSTGTIYWEGPVAVSGSVSGAGYAELTGYVTSMVGMF